MLRSVLSSIRDIASTAHTITPPDSADSHSDSAEIIPYTKPLQAAVISKAKTSVGSTAFFAARCAIPASLPRRTTDDNEGNNLHTPAVAGDEWSAHSRGGVLERFVGIHRTSAQRPPCGAGSIHP